MSCQGQKHSVRFHSLPQVQCGGRFFYDYVFTAAKKATPVVISPQHRLIHEGQALNPYGCSVNFIDAFHSAVSSLCGATLARSTIVSSPPLPRPSPRRFFEVRS
jgi:hypothetical protein